MGMFVSLVTFKKYVYSLIMCLGISNLLNIVDSCLPRRYASRKPKTVTFKAYTFQQITDILMDRLKAKMVRIHCCLI